MYPWRTRPDLKNDFFMYATPDCLAVGGLGHFAIHLDSELLQVGDCCEVGGDAGGGMPARGVLRGWIAVLHLLHRNMHIMS